MSFLVQDRARSQGTTTLERLDADVTLMILDELGVDSLKHLADAFPSWSRLITMIQVKQVRYMSPGSAHHLFNSLAPREKDGHVAKESPSEAQTIVEVLRLCGNLGEVDFLWTTEEHAEAFLQGLESNPRMLYADLGCKSSSSQPLPPDLYLFTFCDLARLMARWPMLKRLEVHNAFRPAVEGSALCDHQAAGLVDVDLSGSTARVSEVHHLLKHSFGSLERLRLEDVSGLHGGELSAMVMKCRALKALR